MRNTSHYNRRITIKKLTRTGDGIGGAVESYTSWRDIHAHVMVKTGGEDFTNAVNLNVEYVNFKIRYIDGIEYTDVIEYNGGTYQIRAMDEIGFRSEMIISTYRKLNAS